MSDVTFPSRRVVGFLYCKRFPDVVFFHMVFWFIGLSGYVAFPSRRVVGFPSRRGFPAVVFSGDTWRPPELFDCLSVGVPFSEGWLGCSLIRSGGSFVSGPSRGKFELVLPWDQGELVPLGGSFINCRFHGWFAAV